MPGHLGNVNRTIQNLTIVKIMPDENIMLVKGSIPGHKGSVVVIKPTEKKYIAKEIFTEREVKEESENLDSTEKLDSSATSDENIENRSSSTEADTSKENKDKVESGDE